MIHLELCKKLKFDHTNKWYMHNPESVLENGTHKLFWDFAIQTDHQNFGQTTRSYNNKQKKNENLKNCGLCRAGVKIKECEKRNKYLDLARELKKLSNRKMTIIPIVIGTLGTVTKGLGQGLEDLEITGRVETIQTTALLRSTRIQRRVLKT